MKPRPMPPWRPEEAESWESLLGLVSVPLFAPGSRIQHQPGGYFVLLDGRSASFAMSVADQDPLASAALSWSWSAHLRFFLTLDAQRGAAYLRRWDYPDDVRRFEIPRKGQDALDLVRQLHQLPPPRSVDVISFLLGTFRVLSGSIGNPLTSLRVLNALLLCTEKARRQEVDSERWRLSTTVAEALSILSPDERMLSETQDLSSEVLGSTIAGLPETLVAPEPTTGQLLEPELLLRHASKALYQEAHLAIERDPQLKLFLLPSTTVKPSRIPPKRDVRLTPETLARSLVIEAMAAYSAPALPRPLDILDPACGSGVFLQEAIRELARQRFTGRVVLRGFDVSHISVSAARFCLTRAKADLTVLGASVEIRVDTLDALKHDWGHPDLILMNPPFVAWDTMNPHEQSAVRRILGSHGWGRLDMASAFLFIAMTKLSPAGVLASVLPASLLETRTGEPLRKELLARTTLRLVGRFEGTDYFRGSTVEPGFIVVQQKDASISSTPSVTVVFSRSGFEDEALRALRISSRTAGRVADKNFEVYAATQADFQPATWLPRASSDQRLVAFLRELSLPRASDLFRVYQGALTGDNATFLVSSTEWKKLHPDERKYFRPALTNKTVAAGSILKGVYCFYPYDDTGLMLTTEAQLRRELSTFYRERLLPARDRLRRRRGLENQWWRLSEERAWQRKAAPKLVSTYFGDQGSFAYDRDGQFLVVHGYGWLWRSTRPVASGPSRAALSFHESSLPYAYLGLLNSSVMASILGCFCPTVAGGQYNLSRRYIDRVPLPNLANPETAASSSVQSLVAAGLLLFARRPDEVDQERLNEHARLLYGLPPELIETDY